MVKQDYMGNYDNMMEKILKTPTAKDIEPKALQSFLNHYGFKLKRSSGSHFIYEYPIRYNIFRKLKKDRAKV